MKERKGSSKSNNPYSFFVAARSLFLEAVFCDNLALYILFAAAVINLLQPCGAVEPPGGEVERGG